MFAAISAMMISTALLVAVPAAGADKVPAVQPPSRLHIPTQALDLSDSRTRAALERWIDRAAALVCGVDPAASAEARREQYLCMIAAGNAARARLKQIQSSRQVQTGSQMRTAGL